MELKTVIELEVDGTPIIHFNNFKLIQKFNSHHEFELSINYDVIEASGNIKLGEAQRWIGAVFTASFNSGQNNFRGIVCEVSLSQQHGLRSNIIVKGFSTSIVLESGPKLQSFNEKKLDEIVKKVAEKCMQGQCELSAKASYQDQIGYQTQFKESDFGFINRLSFEYGEWFYYDGVNLCFGKPDKLPEVELTLGRNLSVLNSAVRVLPMQFSNYSYQSSTDDLLDGKAEGSNSMSNSYIDTAISRSKEVFSSSSNLPVKPRTINKQQLDTLGNSRQAGIAAGLTDVHGESTVAALAIGSIADIQVSIREGLASFNQQSLDKYLITEITHEIDGLSRYKNTFKGVPADTSVIPSTPYLTPIAEAQVATVKENLDPENKGRVRVQMLWQQHNDMTDWIRVLTPDGGSSDLISQNRGYVFVPEIGDQVILGFRYNDPNRPFVMGSVFHGRTAAGGYEQNHLKSITTRSGHLIEFDDDQETQGITIRDHNSNKIHIDTKGNNITVTALETMTFNAKNLNINVQEDMTVNVNRNMITQVTQGNKINVGKQYELFADNIKSEATNNYVVNAKKVDKTADHVNINSKAENLTLFSGKSVVSKSVEKNKLF
ncbi:hypothetical protein PBAL39_00827 [Pedobacter sp. BAL39]|uniref:type VI secretion system Vgr family protein n=1 Tax=Pedobacter sp. BAL39 TaxID=391596 RepID=UPI0001559EA6|nr:phage baseplate assembly protein V [Pedobacter sp. BAL39]EDM38114.1 hypothetical protein PBAL39_00827 [Pedobacter sp. BAL39]